GERALRPPGRDAAGPEPLRPPPRGARGRGDRPAGAPVGDRRGHDRRRQARRRRDARRLRPLPRARRPVRGRGALREADRIVMRLEGIHHVTCITADAPGNVEFYAGTLGLRLVKKTVNQDDPTVYHLFYADERGSAGSDITFFEYPGVPRGRAGDGMVHRVVFRVGSEEALDFWAERVGGERSEESLLFADPEGLALELILDRSGDEPL